MLLFPNTRPSLDTPCTRRPSLALFDHFAESMFRKRERRGPLKSPFVRTEERRCAFSCCPPSLRPSAIRCAPCSMAEGDTSRFVRATSCLTNTIGGFLPRQRETDELTVRSRVNKGAFTSEQAPGRLFNHCLMARSFAPRQRFKRWVDLHGQVQLGVGKDLFIQ